MSLLNGNMPVARNLRLCCLVSLWRGMLASQVPRSRRSLPFNQDMSASIHPSLCCSRSSGVQRQFCLMVAGGVRRQSEPDDPILLSHRHWLDWHKRFMVVQDGMVFGTVSVADEVIQVHDEGLFIHPPCPGTMPNRSCRWPIQEGFLEPNTWENEHPLDCIASGVDCTGQSDELPTFSRCYGANWLLSSLGDDLLWFLDSFTPVSSILYILWGGKLYLKLDKMKCWWICELKQFQCTWMGLCVCQF